MIKKLFALLAALCLCVLLMSCGKEEVSNQEGNLATVMDREQIAAMFKDKSANITYLVQVSINPEFELYLDDRGEVCDLICLNEDAKAAFAEIHVAQKYYEAAMTELLAAAKAGGYLTDESTIAMTVVVRASGEMGDTIIADLEKTVQEYASAEQYTLQILDGREQESDEGNQTAGGEEVRDADGKLVSRT